MRKLDMKNSLQKNTCFFFFSQCSSCEFIPSILQLISGLDISRSQTIQFLLVLNKIRNLSLIYGLVQSWVMVHLKESWTSVNLSVKLSQLSASYKKIETSFTPYNCSNLPLQSQYKVSICSHLCWSENKRQFEMFLHKWKRQAIRNSHP